MPHTAPVIMLIPVGRRLVPFPFSPVFLRLAVHGDRHKPIRLHILKLDNLMAAAGKLAPPARLVGVLLDGGILASFHGERHGLETLLAGAADREPIAFDLDLVGAQQLLGDGA